MTHSKNILSESRLVGLVIFRSAYRSNPPALILGAHMITHPSVSRVYLLSPKVIEIKIKTTISPYQSWIKIQTQSCGWTLYQRRKLGLTLLVVASGPS